MTLHQLRAFDVLARYLSVTKAAHHLNISQPALSKQLKLLEIEYQPLYEKNGRGIKLTSEGLRFRHSIEPILLQLSELDNDFKKHRQKSKKVFLAIGATPSPSTILLPKVLKTFKKTHSQVLLMLRTGDSRAMEQLLLNSEIEIGLITNPSHNSEIILERFRMEKVVGVVASTSSLAKSGKIDEQDLAKTPLIIKTGKILRPITRTGIKLNIVMECDSLETVLAAVRNDMGVGVLYRDIAEPGLRKGDLRPIEIPMLNQLKIFCYIAYARSTSLSQEAKGFLEILRCRKRRYSGMADR
jgi:DNA-binding transcriptional LysR family regulator